VLGALGIVLLSALAAPLWASLPWSLSLSAAGVILAGGFAVLVGAACTRGGLAARAFEALCWGLLVAGVVGSLIGLVQVYRPQWADGDWIARAALAGRASGNLRQPNHLASVLLWAMVAATWLGDTGRLPRVAAWVANGLMLFVAVLTASRTGAVAALGLAVWGGVDRRLSGSTRVALLVVPLAYVLFWFGITEWAHVQHQAFSGEARFLGKGDVSASRFGIWSNTFALIAAHPWVGVGFGDFNFAWSLTAFPDRPVAFFDHTHNLPLQFAVELGLPIAVVVLSLLGHALWRSFRRAAAAGSMHAPPERAAFVIVLMAAVHSQLEYPLWYSYFLLPVAFAWGLCLAEPTAEKPSGKAHAAGTSQTRPLVLGCMALVLAGAVAVWDYARVVVIFAPPDGAGPLEDRIAEGRRSWFFAPHADYAAATVAEHPSTVMPSFTVATHYLLDTRLMMAWAKALEESGDDEKARWVAARLREFRNPAAEVFFGPCIDPSVAADAKPFQCRPPTRRFSYLDFR